MHICTHEQILVPVLQYTTVVYNIYNNKLTTMMQRIGVKLPSSSSRTSDPKTFVVPERPAKVSTRMIVQSVASEEIYTSMDNKKDRMDGPEPKRFAVAEGYLKDVGACSAATLLRLGAGALVLGYRFSMERISGDDTGYAVMRVGGLFKSVEKSSCLGGYPRPSGPLVLFHRTDSGECKRVREALSILDIDVMVYPIPDGGPRWTSVEGFEQGMEGPVLVDSTHGVTLRGADTIVEHLFTMYSNPTKIPWILGSNAVSDFLLHSALKMRAGKGSMYRGNGMVPEKPLVFWAYEASPFCAVVQEVLCELAIPHVIKNVARGSAKRSILYGDVGHFQAPFLEDPNQNVCMFESAAIIEHLLSNYGQE
jgi:hypothetical protein